jgi:oligopeptide transport system substrate-binding protein
MQGAPLRKDIIDKYGAKWIEAGNFVGSGPYMLKEWKHQEKVVIVANPNYYGAKPTLQEIDYSIIVEPKAEFEAYKAGELDVCNNVLDSDLTSIKVDPTLSKEFKVQPQLGTYMFVFNNQKPPFDNKKVRQAFSMAIDKKNFADVVAQGTVFPSNSFLPVGMPGHDDTIGFSYDPAKAKQLLAEAGYPDGKGLPPITYVYNTSAAHKIRAEYLQDQLKKNLGVDIKIETMEWGALLALCKTKDAPQMFRMGWNGDYPHPQDFLDIWFRSVSTQNYAKYANKDFDKLLDQAATTADQAKQIDLYKQAEKILVDDAPVVFFYYYGRPYLTKPWVKNLTVTPIDGSMQGQYFFDKVQILAH